MERHRFRVAEAELKRALVLNPKSVDARRRLIWLYAQQGRSAEIAAESVALRVVVERRILGYGDVDVGPARASGAGGRI